MARYLLTLVALLIATFLFGQSEGKVIQKEKEDAVLLGNRTFEIVDNLTIKGFKPLCVTEGDIWRCCVGVESGINVTVCMSIQYLEDEYGLELNVTLNSILLFHEKVSARNPPPICVHIPHLKKIAYTCFKVYDLDIKRNHLIGCVDFEGYLEFVKVFRFKLGCFDFPVHSLKKKNPYVNFMKN